MPAFFLLSNLNAQTTTCNANFTWNGTGTTFKFLPEITTDAVGVYYHWTFGDGSLPVSTISPYHTFPSTGGVFVITHTMYVYNPNGVLVCKDSVTKEIAIQADCVIPDFTYHASALNFLKIEFTNTSQFYTSTDSIAWMFGDGTTSNDINPSHIYANAGVYHVCLLIKKRNTNTTCVREKCYDVVVSRPCDLQADFNWQKDPINFTKVYFANATINSSTNDSLTWSFGDGTFSHGTNPDHIYANAGKYTVCLTVRRNNITAGAAVCQDSTCKLLEIAVPDCNIVPDFTSTANATLTTQIKFTNTTTGLLATDSIKWSFGDGTYSKDISPTHNYAPSGTYVVVMEVRRINSAGQILCIKNITKEIHVVEPCIFTPNFTFRNDSAIGNPYKFYFEYSNTTVNSYDSIRWNFGDGTDGANGRTVTHTFPNAGTYNVCVTIIKLDKNYQPTNCTKNICKTIVIAASCDFTAGYTWKADSTNKKKINFTNTTTLSNANGIATWSFGDGSANVTGWNATHEYAVAGKYYVCLRVQYGTNTACVKYKCDSVTVQNNPAPCDFTVSYTTTASTVNHKLIYFTAINSLPTGTVAQVSWTFGDGSTGTGTTLSHEYAQPGKYYVCVRIQYSATCVKEKCDSIIVYDNPVPCDFVAGYSWHADGVNTKKIYFTNTTVLPTPNAIVKWTFGDGTDANSWDAVHEYATAGKYYVCLRVQYGTSTSCIKEKCDSITVIVPPTTDCKQLSLYTYAPTSAINLYSFTPLYQNNDVQYTWTFGDGMGSHDMISTHQFAQLGTYNVCLTAFKNTNCASTTCKEVRIAAPVNCDTVKVAYQYYKDQYMANKIHFFAYSNAPIQQQVWTIIKGTATNSVITLTQNNPIYDFSDTGYYYVCLKITTTSGCVKQFCSQIHIEKVTQLCELQTYPNPASSQITLYVQETATEVIHAYIYDALNNLVGEKNQAGVVGANSVVLNISSLPTGFYTVKLIYGNQVCFAKFQKI